MRTQASVKVVGSYGWLKVLTATPLGEAYRPAFTSSRELLVPSVCALDLALALDAARIGQACQLPFPDNAVLAPRAPARRRALDPRWPLPRAARHSLRRGAGRGSRGGPQVKGTVDSPYGCMADCNDYDCIPCSDVGTS